MAETTELKESIRFADTTKCLPPESWDLLGYSAGQNAIRCKRFEKKNAPRLLLIGGVHGNETEGVAFSLGFLQEYKNYTQSPFACDVLFIPLMNPDGVLNYSRHNANGVDLNRNMPTKDWQSGTAGEKYFPGNTAGSEPETAILLNVLETYKPDFIISMHSWKPMINVNGPAHKIAEKIKENLDYIITEDIGYPTPGSLGTYAGWERKIPTITLEIERGIPLDSVYPLLRAGIHGVLNHPVL